MAFNTLRPYTSSLLFQQALIQGRILFDIIFDSDLDDLSGYRVLVLPDQDFLHAEQLAAITRFVHNGGGLVITEGTSLYCAGRRRRQDFGLRELLPGVPVPPFVSAYQDDGIVQSGIVQNQIGAGRVVYIPQVGSGMIPVATGSLSRLGSNIDGYKLPENSDALLDAVRWAAGAPLSLEVTGPATLAASMLRASDGLRYVIHLVNYACGQGPASGVGIRFPVPAGRRPAAVRYRKPDDGTGDRVQYTDLPHTKDGGVLVSNGAGVATYYAVTDGVLVANIPDVSTYGVVTVDFE